MGDIRCDGPTGVFLVLGGDKGDIYVGFTCRQ